MTLNSIQKAYFFSLAFLLIGSSHGFFVPWTWWGEDDSGETRGRNGWSTWLDLEDSSEEDDSDSVDLEDLVLTISLDGPPKTAKPTTLATTTTDSPRTTTKPKQKPKG